MVAALGGLTQKPVEFVSVNRYRPYSDESQRFARVAAHREVDRYYDSQLAGHEPVPEQRAVLQEHARWTVLHVVGGLNATAIADYINGAKEVRTIEYAVKKLCPMVDLKHRIRRWERSIEAS